MVCIDSNTKDLCKSSSLAKYREAHSRVELLAHFTALGEEMVSETPRIPLGGFLYGILVTSFRIGWNQIRTQLHDANKRTMESKACQDPTKLIRSASEYIPPPQKGLRRQGSRAELYGAEYQVRPPFPRSRSSVLNMGPSRKCTAAAMLTAQPSPAQPSRGEEQRDMNTPCPFPPLSS